jgi:hypothetical protein
LRRLRLWLWGAFERRVDPQQQHRDCADRRGDRQAYEAGGEIAGPFFSQPIRNGPPNPDKLPSELIAAMPAAAEAPVRKLDGIGQNIGGTAETPICAKHNSAIFSTGLSTKPERPIPTAAMPSATATWPRRSIVLSEWRLSTTMPTAPKTNGNAETTPVMKFDRPNPLTIVGRK